MYLETDFCSIRFVPSLSNAISRSASPPAGETLVMTPRPKTL